MTRIATLLVGFGLLATLALAAVPTAAAETAFTCAEFDGNGGLVGRTIEYVGNLWYAACVETLSYAVYVCQVLLGPDACQID